MAYFLKQSKLKKGIYLQIYQSFYDPIKKYSTQRSYKAIGYLDELITNGIDNPVEYFKQEVVKLNNALKQVKLLESKRQISDESPERFLGYFPIKNINDQLRVETHINFLQTQYNFHFKVYSVLSSLIYARVVGPCSKHKTFHDVLPNLFEEINFSQDQMYSAVEFLGLEYEKIIEIYNHAVNSRFHFDTSINYFDCTNFYFEIDKEDDFRRKGPSKENRKDPIVGLGLLLDANQIPIGMKLYPGNQSEKPIIREVLEELKKRHDIKGKVVRVADKGLNCAENIAHARSNNDGYIFSKSVKQLPEVEKTWILLNNDYTDVTDSKGKLLYRWKECIDKFSYDIPLDAGKKKKVLLTEKRVVTYNPGLAKKKIMEINKQVEKAKYLNASQAKRSEYGDSSKYVVFKSTDKDGMKTKDKVAVEINQEAIDIDKKLAGYNLLVTSELKMKALDIYNTYHQLWRIEESFRIMKSELDARPVYLQKEETIIGHFLICYLAFMLTRILQFKILDDKYSSSDIFKFFKTFRFVKISDFKFINMTKSSDFIKDFSLFSILPLTSYYLNSSEIKSLLNNRF